MQEKTFPAEPSMLKSAGFCGERLLRKSGVKMLLHDIIPPVRLQDLRILPGKCLRILGGLHIIQSLHGQSHEDFSHLVNAQLVSAADPVFQNADDTVGDKGVGIIPRLRGGVGIHLFPEFHTVVIAQIDQLADKGRIPVGADESLAEIPVLIHQLQHLLKPVLCGQGQHYIFKQFILDGGQQGVDILIMGVEGTAVDVCQLADVCDGDFIDGFLLQQVKECLADHGFRIFGAAVSCHKNRLPGQSVGGNAQSYTFLSLFQHKNFTL